MWSPEAKQDQPSSFGVQSLFENQTVGMAPAGKVDTLKPFQGTIGASSFLANVSGTKEQPTNRELFPVNSGQVYYPRSQIPTAYL